MYNRIIKIEIEGLARVLSYPELKIKFSGDFDNDNEPDIIEIEIYNLKKDTINKITEGKFINFLAGHKDNYGSLNIGTINSVKSYKDGPDYITEIKMNTANNEWNNLYISQSFNGPVTASRILDNILPKSELELGDIKLVDNKTYQIGKSINGKLINVIKQISSECNTPIYINDGKISFTKKGVKSAYVLNSKSGLISSPKKIDKKDDNSLWEIKCIFNHNIKTNSIIRLESDVVNGDFKVLKGKYNSNFTIDLELGEV